VRLTVTSIAPNRHQPKASRWSVFPSTLTHDVRGNAAKNGLGGECDVRSVAGLAFTRQRNAELPSRRPMLGGQRGRVSVGLNRPIFCAPGATREHEKSGQKGLEPQEKKRTPARCQGADRSSSLPRNR
jgi:hypothetical protein